MSQAVSIHKDAVGQCVDEVISWYPDELKEVEHQNKDRYVFNVQLVYRPKGRLLDLGSGIGAFL